MSYLASLLMLLLFFFCVAGDILPKYRDILLAAILTGAKDATPEVRASSLSNLGEVCKLLRFSLGSNVHEVTATNKIC